jgi:hypothetical protein
MRTSDRSPSIVPPGNDQDVYLVLAARIVFAFGITALVVISVYFGILWLAG